MRWRWTAREAAVGRDAATAAAEQILRQRQLWRLRRQWAAREAAVAAAAAWQWWLVSAEMAAATDAAATECSANHLPPGFTQVPGVIAWGLCVPSQGRRAILQSALGLSRATGCRSCGPPPDGYFLIAGGLYSVTALRENDQETSSLPCVRAFSAARSCGSWPGPCPNLYSNVASRNVRLDKDRKKERGPQCILNTD